MPRIRPSSFINYNDDSSSNRPGTIYVKKAITFHHEYGVRLVHEGTLPEIREELRRLMEEQIESLTHQAFGGLTKEEALRQDQRLKRIREVSAELLAALKRSSAAE